MHKIIAILFFAGLMLQGSYATEKNPDLKENIKGGFKERITYFFHYKLGEVDSSSKKIHSITKYDKNGDQLEYIYYMSTDGTFLYRTTFQYDDKGILTKDIIYNSDGKIFSNEIFNYDDKGKEIESIRDHPNGLIDRRIFKYDEKGNLIEEIGFSGNEKKRWIIINIYDVQGNVIEKKHCDTNGVIKFKETYKYDKNGNEIEKVRFKKDGSIDDRYVYYYNDKGNMIEKIWFNKDSSVSWNQTYKYDKNGNIIESVHYNSSHKPDEFFKYIYSK